MDEQVRVAGEVARAVDILLIADAGAVDRRRCRRHVQKLARCEQITQLARLRHHDEAPDDAVAPRFSLLLGTLGSVRTKTLKAFPEAAYREIIASLG
jgi:hypothetical protein